MIKINLVVPLVPNSGVAAAGVDGGAPILDDQTTQRQGVVRLVIILVGPIALFVLQNVVLLPDKAQSLANHNKQLAELQDKNNRASSAVTEIKQFRLDQTKLQTQIGSIESLRRDRMREVRTLDLIQRELPERMWISRIDVREVAARGSDLGGKETVFSITGYAASESEITQFNDTLNKTTFLAGAKLESTSEKMIDGHLVKEFTLNCLFPKPQLTTTPEKPTAAPAKGALYILPGAREKLA